MNILLVEDDAVTRRVLISQLKKLGHVVTEAEDGVEGFARFQEIQPQVLITDWDMPRMDGIELCRSVRRLGLDGYTYIIMLTGHDRPEDAQKALEAGVDDFLTKPLKGGELDARCRVSAGTGRA